MALRLTGLMSGIDTESVIQELVAAKQTKVDDAKKAQTKLSWKQDAWKALNTKLKNLQSKYLSVMRFSDSYSKRTTSVSNSSIVSVITGDNAVNGVQSLQVNQLAKTGYLTGKDIAGADGSELTALSKVGDIDGGLAAGETGVITVTAGDKSVEITINSETTISDLLTQIQDAGLNANFDAKQQRFFISSKESGASNDFSITASDANGDKALAALGLKVNLNSDEATLKEYTEWASYYKGDKAATLAEINKNKLIDKAVASRVNSYLEQYKSLAASRDAAEKKIQEINDKYAGTTLLPADEYASQLEEKNEQIAQLEESMKNMEGDDLAEAEEKLKALKEEAEEITAKKTDAETLAAQQKSVSDIQDQMDEIEKYVTITEGVDGEGNPTYSAVETAELRSEVEDSYYNKAKYASEVMSKHDENDTTATGATKVSGQDAEITLNGAVFTNNTNVFEINGLTFTALSETKDGESVTITTQDDTEGIYDMIKDFLTEYNSIINEMDKLYNADSASGYEPLTDDEKDAMSESEIEDWETKIKDALLRRDSNLSSVSSVLKSIMSAGIEVNGKTMYLSDFGISTLGYFEAADNEKNAYHIDGDEDDEYTSANADKLLGMISNDPDTVISFFSQLSRNLYSKMTELSSSVDGYRSYGSFYDDKKMKEDYDDYTTQIAELEEKLADYEDKWYAKFAAMETALAKLQSNVSAVTSLLGG
ncbi:MAG TPA: flagellar filament capping protein FliD [Candidatus Acetatifactor stercoripullorum]|uniref:Flagellar hook-associated protein 2 n=1 Tax=Candidatus Acetatifactor stercoripullorum TaxID=2838414 RepID=A0A9D1R6D6_9FIRM|nr:flagellar filament capping protein FliD [uncultured Acetatifactor sp.]HIW81820.1 flagellar filament capping protein FliD [Candidatus Acetatifactor stercoripullorum]